MTLPRVTRVIGPALTWEGECIPGYDFDSDDPIAIFLYRMTLVRKALVLYIEILKRDAS